MKITRAAEYAVRCVLYLAMQGAGVLATRKEISDFADIPPKFLAKIAQELARAGVLEIRQGAKGGFVLLRDPKEITLLQVVEIMIGEIRLNDCTTNPKGCQASASCSVNRVWGVAREQLRKTLGAATFASLVAEKSCIMSHHSEFPLI